EGIIRHHLDPLGSLANWDPAQVILPKAEWLKIIDFVVLEDRSERARLRSHLDIQPLNLSDREINDLVAFMHSLTGTESIFGRLGRPDRVPSELPVD
ncbi:MAG: cytochrome C peroxidase, partial [Deltaproteobacteria bacterium]|nr:cytochrome C peroxidase [Deltaproteobacteria bacterium]